MKAPSLSSTDFQTTSPESQLVTFNSDHPQLNCSTDSLHQEGLSFIPLSSCDQITGTSQTIENSSLYLNTTWSSPPEEPLSLWHIVLFGSMACIVVILTVGGNLIVLMSFVLERTIRQPTNYFIASLAVSDLLIGSISMPFYTVYLLSGKKWVLGEQLCDLWLSIDYTACLCSIYTVFCITADRFCSVKIPAKYRRWRTERKVFLMIALTWILPISLFFPSIFGWQYFAGKRTVPSDMCYVQYMEDAIFNCILQIGYFWITLATMIFLYGGIYRVALDLHRRSLAQKEKTMSCLVSMAGRTVTQIGSVMSMPRRTQASIDQTERPHLSDLEEKEMAPNSNQAADSQNRLGKSNGGERLDTKSNVQLNSYKSYNSMYTDNAATLHKTSQNSNYSNLNSPAAVKARFTRSLSERPRIQHRRYPKYHRNEELNMYNERLSRNDEAIEMQYLSAKCNKQNLLCNKQNILYCDDSAVMNHVTNDVTESLFTSSSAAYAVAAAPEMLHHLCYVDEDDDDAELSHPYNDTQKFEMLNLLGTTDKPTQRNLHSTCSITVSSADQLDDKCENNKNLFNFDRNLSSLSTPPVFDEDTTDNFYLKNGSNLNCEHPKPDWQDTKNRNFLLSSGSTASTCLTPSYFVGLHSPAMRRNTWYEDWDIDEDMSNRSPYSYLGVSDGSRTAERLPSSETDSELNQLDKTAKEPRCVTKYVFKREKSTDTNTSKTTTSTIANQLAQSNNRTRKALRTISIILGAFAVCWIPWHVLSMIIGFCKKVEPLYCVEPVLYDISYYLCYLNSPINPFCYAFANQQFKKTFVRLLKFDWRSY